MNRVMRIENKREGLADPASIAWVEVKEKGKRLEYERRVFRSLRGQGHRTNYFDMETREEYWISGRRKDGRDNTDVEIDDEAPQEYWMNIRRLPENIEKNFGPWANTKNFY